MLYCQYDITFDCPEKYNNPINRYYILSFSPTSLISQNQKTKYPLNYISYYHHLIPKKHTKQYSQHYYRKSIKIKILQNSELFPFLLHLINYDFDFDFVL